MLHYFIGICLLLGSSYTAFSQGIKFEKGTWEAVVAKAQAQNKPIFVDAYTTWCGPCKWMAKEVFTQEEVAAYVNTHFVAYKMDMEKGEGPAFARTNKINAYPTLLYFNSEGLLLHKAAGARNAEQLIQLCEDALDPAKQIGTFQKRYTAGVREAEFLKEYVKVLAESGEDVSEPFGEYWEAVEEQERYSSDMLSLMALVTEDFSDVQSPLTAYLLKNRAAYEKEVPQEVIDYYLLQTYIYYTYVLAQMDDNADTEQQIQELLEYYPEAQPDYKARLEFYRAALESPPEEKKVNRARKRYLKTTIDMSELDELAWNLLSEASATKKELKEALKWMERSTETNAHYYNLHIKAAILQALGQENKAIPVAQKALELGAEMELNEEEMEETRALLKKMQS
jgi:thiol-disulfide isomerase/thioredoxin